MRCDVLIISKLAVPRSSGTSSTPLVAIAMTISNKSQQEIARGHEKAQEFGSREAKGGVYCQYLVGDTTVLYTSFRDELIAPVVHFS